jgi:hypothetical protein
MIDRGTLAGAVHHALGDPPDDRAAIRAAGEFALARSAPAIRAAIVLRAWRARPLSADNLLIVCAALGLDPVTLRAASPGMPQRNGMILWPYFAAGLSVWRHSRDMTIREAGDRVSVSSATLYRAERCRPVSDESYLALCTALGGHPHDWTATPDQHAAWQADTVVNVSRVTGCETERAGRAA